MVKGFVKSVWWRAFALSILDAFVCVFDNVQMQRRTYQLSWEILTCNKISCVQKHNEIKNVAAKFALANWSNKNTDNYTSKGRTFYEWMPTWYIHIKLNILLERRWILAYLLRKSMYFPGFKSTRADQKCITYFWPRQQQINRIMFDAGAVEWMTHISS